MKHGVTKLLFTSALLAVLLLGCKENMLSIDKVSYHPETDASWVVAWNDSLKHEPFPLKPLGITRYGIGTVVIRDGLRCCGPNTPLCEKLVSIPASVFSAVAMGGYNLCINETGRTPRSWCYDLSVCCGIVLDYASGSVIVYTDPNCAQITTTAP
jgi:hypothetical protein